MFHLMLALMAMSVAGLGLAMTVALAGAFAAGGLLVMAGIAASIVLACTAPDRRAAGKGTGALVAIPIICFGVGLALLAVPAALFLAVIA